MKNIVINILILLFIYFCNAQKVQRKKIFINISECKLNCDINIPLKRVENKEIIFNLCGKAIFYYTKNSDTLDISALKNYKTSSIEEVKKYENQWKKKKYKEFELKRKKDSNNIPRPLHLANKDYIFKTYLIEIISKNKIVIYPVEWRDFEIQK